MYKVMLKLYKFFLKYEGVGAGRGEGQIDPLSTPPEKTTFKKPSLIRVNCVGLHFLRSLKVNCSNAGCSLSMRPIFNK